MSLRTTQTIHGSYLMPSLGHASVADAMHPGIITCDAEATLTEVARTMATHHVHSVAVLSLARGSRPSEEAEIWGIVSDLDLISAGIRGGPERPAADLAHQPPLIVEPTLPLREAGELMVAHGAPHALVVEPATNRPVGMLSTLDIVGILAWGEA